MPEVELEPLEGGCVEIGWLHLDAKAAGDDLALLSPAEQERAGRLRARAARVAFVQTRQALRLALGRHLALPPEEVPMHVSANGKPELTAGTGLQDLRFSLSHSRGLALCAFSLGREVGIDVEWRAPNLPWLEMAASAFSPSEQTALAALPASAQRLGFYAGWTRKEAWLKGLGTGFAAGEARAMDVPIGSGILSAQPLLAPSGMGWTLCDLSVPGQPGDYAAALACEGPAPRLRWRALSAAPNRSAA